MNKEVKLPDDLQMAYEFARAVWPVAGTTADKRMSASDAIRTEHSQRLTLQHNCADLAQRVAELGGELETERMRLAACGVIAMSDTPESAEKARQMLPIYESASASDVARRVDECMALRAKVAELEAERDTARGAVRELEHKVFSQGQALDVLRACVARHQRDELDPPGYLQDAVVRAAGLGALHTERDAAIKERDKLRARLAELELQEPVASIADRKIGEDGPLRVKVWEGNCVHEGQSLYARPVHSIPEGWKLVKVKAAEFDSLMYWLERCESKGHMEQCSDLIQPWVEFAYEDIAAPEYKA